MRFQVSAAAVLLSVASLVVANPHFGDSDYDDSFGDSLGDLDDLYDDSSDSYGAAPKSYGHSHSWAYSPGSDYSEKDSGDNDNEPDDYKPTWYNHYASATATTTSAPTSWSTSTSTSTGSQSTWTSTTMSGTSQFEWGESGRHHHHHSTHRWEHWRHNMTASHNHTSKWSTYTSSQPRPSVYRTLWNFTMPNATATAGATGTGTAGTISLPTVASTGNIATVSPTPTSSSTTTSSSATSTSTSLPHAYSNKGNAIAGVNNLAGLAGAVFALAVMGL